MQLKVKRPIIIFDIEATGVNVQQDRIVDICAIKIFPDGHQDVKKRLVNPEIPIPKEASEIHGITDADIADAPAFSSIAKEIDAILSGCELGGYNAARFDIPLLVAEMERAGVHFDLSDRKIIDAQRIFHQREPRDLTAALKFYCNETHHDAHTSLGDVMATIRVLEGQYERYPDLPEDIEKLHDYCNPRHPHWVDQQGRIRWVNGEAAINFGKNQGRLLRNLIETDSGFLHWILQNDFPIDTKQVIRDAMKGVFPSPPDLESK